MMTRMKWLLVATAPDVTKLCSSHSKVSLSYVPGPSGSLTGASGLRPSTIKARVGMCASCKLKVYRGILLIEN